MASPRAPSRDVAIGVIEASEDRIDPFVVSHGVCGAQAKDAVAAVSAALTGGEPEMEGRRCVLLVPLFADATRQKVGLWRALWRMMVEAV